MPENAGSMCSFILILENIWYHFTWGAQNSQEIVDLFQFSSVPRGPTLAFRFHAFPEIPKMSETRAHKKLSFQHYHETKMSQIMVFWSIREIKTPRNIVIRLNRGIKMQQNS